MQKLPITGLEVGSVAPAVLVVGDPARADHAAAKLNQTVLLNEQREYRAFQGAYQGMPVTVCSHGIGAPGAAIAFEELIAAGAKWIVRAGTCGGLQPEMKTGDLVIATAAVNHTGFGDLTVPKGYPAVADPKLTMELKQAAQGYGRHPSYGIVLSSDSFYPGNEARRRQRYQDLSHVNVLAVEMECAALFIVGSLRRVPTAAFLTVDGNVLHQGERMDEYQPRNERVENSVDAEIEIALRALIKFGTDA